MKRRTAKLAPVQRRRKEAPLGGQVSLNGQSLSDIRLEDKIPSNVHTLFVGINPGLRSATIGHYYAGKTNRFWDLLHSSGIWPVPLTTENDDDIVTAGFGLTDVAKRPTPGTGAISWVEFAASRERISKIVKKFKPKTVVFVSKTAVRAFRGDNRAIIHYGLQEWPIGDAKVFVVPSTSGASYADTSYKQKLEWFRKLRLHVGTYYGFVLKA